MNPHELNKSWFSLARQIVTSLARELTRTSQDGGSDPAQVYTSTLGYFVDSLLSTPHSPEPPFDSALARPIDRLASTMGSKPSAEAVGRFYEYLRGFRLELKPGQDPALVASAKGKRNQGLFYTPQVIVKHIVSRALDELDIRDPEDYLSLRIVDPAMGTAAFLVEALEQITSRVTTRRSVKSTHDVADAMNRAREIPRNASVTGSRHLVDVRLGILENSLYGIDIDPIAVRIARAVLRERVFAGIEGPSEIQSHLKVGNALIGTAKGEPHSVGKGMADEAYFRAFFCHGPQETGTMERWVNAKRVFHWPIEFPEVFAREGGGFDAVVGNPPYEVVSVKESGIEERRRDQAYFRRAYRTCRGKINTYRLMLERGIDLLRDGGVLGFIVPATFMADSTAERLRQMVLDESRIVEAVVIPEKARVFDGVTQALLILIARKGSRTHTITPIFWNGSGSIPDKGAGEIDRRMLTHTGLRVPLLQDESDKKLLQALMRHPRLGGNGSIPPSVTVHQGEINLTVHREYITDQRTDFPLIRGEHVAPLHVAHPCQRGKKLDWVLGESFLEDGALPDKRTRTGDLFPKEEPDRVRARGAPWEKERIVLARVVNMGTDRRLKAALAPVGAFLGDMTNYIAESSAPMAYLLGLLNSRLLNWRFKLTSTNNYVSAREVEDLPVPLFPSMAPPGNAARREQLWYEDIIDGPDCTIGEYIALLSDMPGTRADRRTARPTSAMIERTVELISGHERCRKAPTRTALWNLLDALVLKLYGVEQYVHVIERP